MGALQFGNIHVDMVKNPYTESLLTCAVNELTRNSPLLKAGQKKAAKLSGADDACQFDSGRDAPSACKFFILDVSEIAKELGLPVCNEVSPTCQAHEERGGCRDAQRHLQEFAQHYLNTVRLCQLREERQHA